MLVIQSYLVLRHILAHSGILGTLCNPHIHSLVIFWALTCSEPETYLKPCETLTRHIQNPVIGYYSDIFRTLCNIWVGRNLAYSESWNIENSSIIASQCILRTLSYLQKFKNIQNTDMFKTQHIFRTLLKVKIESFAKNKL